MDESQDNQPTQPLQPNPMEPVVFTPQTTNTLQIEHQNDSPQPVTPPETTLQPPAEIAPPQPAVEPATEPAASWQYQSGQLEPSQGYTQPTPSVTNANNSQDDETFSWDPPTNAGHEKTAKWYILLAVGAIVLAVAIYAISRDVIATAVVGIVAVAVGVFASLKPRAVSYSVGPDGIAVGEKHFSYSAFKSFSVMQEAAEPYIQLMPQKRFMVPVTLYFSAADADKIANLIGEFLPYEHKEIDFIDRLSSRLHF